MTITSLFRVSVLSVMALCGVVAFDQAAPGIFLAEAVAQDKPKLSLIHISEPTRP